MKTQSHILLLALLSTLLVFKPSAIAEEKLSLGSNTALTSTTVSGGVDAVFSWQINQTLNAPHRECRGWLQRLFHRLGFHGRH